MSLHIQGHTRICMGAIEWRRAAGREATRDLSTALMLRNQLTFDLAAHDHCLAVLGNFFTLVLSTLNPSMA